MHGQQAKPEEAFVTVDVPTAPPLRELLTRPSVAEVFVHAAAQIHRATADLWPDAPVCLEQHVPSVTSYVHRARVGDRTLYAKVSILGVSLVSLLRGACGNWSNVLQAQREYEARADGLLEREAAQLRLLAAMERPRVCALAGVERGVMFTEPVTGPSLGDLLLVHPGDTAELLALSLAELRPLHRTDAARRLGSAGAIGERSIAGTFLRKFNGLSGAVYVDRLGAERCDTEQRQEVVELLRRTVARLHRLRMALPPVPRTMLAYGDLKPEHVVFPDGPEGRPVLLDPGLLRAGPAVDVAKLLSRTVLFLAARQPGAATARQVVEGLGEFEEARALRLPRRARRVWLRELLTLWLMDTTNILTTYLSAPAALPLPGYGLALVERAGAVCALVEAVSADLATSADARSVWERALTHAVAVTP
ncbi:phosphotransferase [Streptomyces triticirhizae]|uniref:phosphotransferase n=1 Tax=Streptomyces triticirhizae TaxID=2483353 RepID=UPI001F44D6A8|nr:phosphotransferase [Streptomyces triticirhizae]